MTEADCIAGERAACAGLIAHLLRGGFDASMTERPGRVVLSAEWPGGRSWRGEGRGYVEAMEDFTLNAKDAAHGW